MHMYVYIHDIIMYMEFIGFIGFVAITGETDESHDVGAWAGTRRDNYQVSIEQTLEQEVAIVGDDEPTVDFASLDVSVCDRLQRYVDSFSSAARQQPSAFVAGGGRLVGLLM